MRFISATAFCVTLVLGICGSQAQQARPTAPQSGQKRAQTAPADKRVKALPTGSDSSTGRARLSADQGRPSADQEGQGRREEPASPELDQLLKEWASETMRIHRLEGEHVRRHYDLTFEIEKLSEGKFYWEAPDKGRIDVQPVKVTEKMMEDRKKGTVKSRKKQNKEPFDLKAANGEQWICDGKRVYEIDVEKKECRMVQLPPGLQGVNIMDSPLPFLFGMPPEKAKARFEISFSKPFNRADGVAFLVAKPKTAQDAENWSKAEIILDLKTFFPNAVQLTDPAETSITVYQFSGLVRNNEGGWKKLIPGLTARNIFSPDLRDYHTINIGPDGPMSEQYAGDADDPAQGKGPALIPNVTGMNHQDAVKQLERLGFNSAKGKDQTIFLRQGKPARNADEMYKVESQEPKAGTPMKAGDVIKLTLWDKPTGGKSQN